MNKISPVQKAIIHTLTTSPGSFIVQGANQRDSVRDLYGQTLCKIQQKSTLSTLIRRKFVQKSSTNPRVYVLYDPATDVENLQNTIAVLKAENALLKRKVEIFSNAIDDIILLNPRDNSRPDLFDAQQFAIKADRAIEALSL